MHKQCNKVHFLTQAQKPCNPEKPNPAPCATRERARQAAWRVGADFILHPLIHTLLTVASIQNMAAGSKEGKCGVCNLHSQSLNRALKSGASDSAVFFEK
jgi:hypothetical protein